MNNKEGHIHLGFLSRKRQTSVLFSDLEGEYRVEAWEMTKKDYLSPDAFSSQASLKAFTSESVQLSV